MNRLSRDLPGILDTLRRKEEASLPSSSFVGSISKGYKYATLVISIVGIGMGYFLSVPIQDPSAGIIFGALGIVALLMLPTCFSYRCYVDKSIMKETYNILCFKIRKEVLWKDVEYKRVKRDSNKNTYYIRLYNSNKTKLISFDRAIVGFGQIMKMAKNVSTLKR